VTENGVVTNYIVIGCVKSLKYYPNFQLQQPKIKVYEWNNKTFECTLFHETEVEDIPLVLYTWK